MIYNNLFGKVFYSKGNWSIRWRLIIPVLLLLLISCLTLKYSSLDVEIIQSTFFKQLIWIIFGIIIFIIVQKLRLQVFNEYAYHLYFILLLLLLSTYFMPSIGGASRWIRVGSFAFQPSELGKLLIIFTLARFISDYKGKVNDIVLLSCALLIIFFPSILIFNQPDFGTAIVYVFIAFPMLYWGDVKPFYIFSVIAPLISIVTAFNLTFFSIWMLVLCLLIYFDNPKILIATISLIVNIICGISSPFIWNQILFPHQRERLLTLLNPMRDPHGSGYQIIQSMTAIGSGGFWGKGLGEGTQTQLRYLPVRDTDFIISVIGEELGLFGILIILCLFYVIFNWFISYAYVISNKFFSISLIGFCSIIFIHLTVNLGMVVGLLPVTGLPVPFISYGGSFLLTSIIIVALVNNIMEQRV